MIQTIQSELFRIRKNRLFWACLALAAFFVFALALTFYHNSVNGMLPVISLVSFTEFLFSDYSLIFPLTLFLCLYFTEDFHTGTYSIALSKGTSRVHLFLETTGLMDWRFVFSVCMFWCCIFVHFDNGSIPV